jgi:hypothetical protein
MARAALRYRVAPSWGLAVLALDTEDRKMVFKKDLTPIGKKGTVTKHKGKGAVEQRTAPRETETLTGGDRFGRQMSRYPKPAPGPQQSAPTEIGLGNAFEFSRKP